MLISVTLTAPDLSGCFFIKMTTQQIATTKKVELSLTLPSIRLNLLARILKEKAIVLLSNIYSPISNTVDSATASASSRARRIRFPQMGDRKFKFDKSFFKKAVPVVLGIIVIVGVISIVRSLPDAQSRPVTSTSQPANTSALATVQLNRKFVFPLLDEKGKEVGSFDYVIQDATIQKQIIVQGQRATAVKGRIFLILSLKITNNLEQSIQLNTRDYLRLVAQSNRNEQLAPDIHNDPVEVQAISTKYTRVGIAINEEDAKKLIQLKVGEIEGEKQNVDLNFKF